MQERFRQLSGIDTGFLAMDHPEQPMFNIATGVLAPDGPPLTIDALVEHLRSRLPQLPSYRWRVVPIPGGVGQPVLLDDPAFEITDHVEHVVLEDAGGAALEALVAELAERPMRMDRPLWRAYLVDGLVDHLGRGRQAVVLHFHHAIADGTAAMAMFDRVFSCDPTPEVPGVPAYRPGPRPSRLRLLWAGLLAQLVLLARVPGLVRRTRRALKAVRARQADADVTVPPFNGGAPWTPLNDAFTPGRTFTRVVLPLPVLLDVRRAIGVSLNDVVLGVVSGALRRLLANRGGLPERSLLANVPAADPAPDALERTWGNDFWSLTTTLATDVEDPLVRLRTIAAVTAESKEQLRLFGVGLVPAWLHVVPPRLVARGHRRVLARLRGATTDVDANVLVSNVRGPAAPYVLLGRTVEELLVCGPPSNGVGLNISVMSYGEELMVSVLAFASALPDGSVLAEALHESFVELADAAGVEVDLDRASTA